MTAQSANVFDFPNETVELDGLRPLVTPGVYELKYTHCETGIYFNKSPKVKLVFRIITPGEFFGVIVERFYNVKKLKGKPGKNGKFVVAARGDFAREFFTIYPRRERLDRLPLTYLKTKIILGRVVTVKKDSKQRDIPDPIQYSVVTELLRVQE